MFCLTSFRSCEQHIGLIDLGDQFLALQRGRTQPADEGRHLGLVVDDKEAVRKRWLTQVSNRCPGRFSTSSTRGAIALRLSATTTSSSPKASNMLRGMGLTHLSKNEKAIKELTDKGMAPS